MLTAEMLIAMVAWPAAAAIAVLSLLWIPALRKSRAVGIIAALAVAAGFIVGYAVVIGRPSFPPPIDAKSGLPFVVAGAVVVAAIATWRSSQAVVWLATAVFASASMWLLLRAAVSYQWTTGQAVVRIAALAAGMTAAIWSAASLETRTSRRTAVTALAALAGLGAPVMAFSDSLVMAQLHGTLGVAVAVLCIATWLDPQRVVLRGAPVVVMGLIWSFWVISLLFANMPVLSFALLFSALPFGLVTAKLVRKTRPGWQMFTTLIVVVGLVAGSVTVGALRYVRTSETGSQPSDAEYDGYGYDL